MSLPALAFVSQGKLFLLRAGESRPENIHSQFGLRVAERAREIQQKRAWKAGDPRNPFGGAALWGSQAGGSEDERIAITSAVLDGARQRLFYFLETSAICGLFRYDLQECEELRLFHRENTRAADLSLHPNGERLACSLRYPDGTASIATVGTDGRGLLAVTEGDVRDAAPSWVPNDGCDALLVFHSAGVARGADGHPAGHGPASIEQLNLETGETITLAQADEFDLLTPKCDREGNLYFIRRPYEGPGRRYRSFGHMIGDIALFPFRLARAFVAYWNLFSLFYARKPLITAGGPRTKEPDTNLSLQGRHIDVQRALRTPGGDLETASLVPASWELVRQDRAGDQVVLARHVAAFDLLEDGSVVYTNGRAVYVVENGAKPSLLAKGHTIEQFSAAVIHDVPMERAAKTADVSRVA